MLKHKPSNKKRLALTAGFLAAFLTVLTIATLVLHDRTQTNLENQLGQRLRALASGLALAVGMSDALQNEATTAELYTNLFLTQGDHNLSNIVVLTTEGLTIIDLQELSLVGELNPFIELDFTAFTLAQAGALSVTPLYRLGDLFLKSAYAPVVDKNGAVVAIIGIEAGAEFFDDLRDLTEIFLTIALTGALVVVVLVLLFYRQSRTLDHAQENMLEKENLAAMGRMVGNIAHEIRNPLSIIRASAQRIERKYKIDDDAIRYITEEVDELNRILTGYLEFAQSRQGEFTSISLGSILARCALAIQPDIDEKHVVIEADTTTDVHVLGDEGRLRQAILNVLLNAVQASPESGVIRVTMYNDNGYGTIVIHDSGPGIPPREIADITKPFYTTKSDGSGLGLSVVKSIAEEHDGQLTVENSDAGGAKVSLRIPQATRG